MASNEEFLPKFKPDDILLWDEELPFEVRYGMEQDANPLDVLCHEELIEVDIAFERLNAQFRRLDILPNQSTFHSVPTTDGYIRIGTSPVPDSDKYDKSQCVRIVINTVCFNVLSSKTEKYITVEDYFIDRTQNRLSCSIDNITTGGKLELPPSAPGIIWQKQGGGYGVFQGEGYQLLAPNSDEPMAYDEIHSTRNTAFRIVQLLSGLNETTRDT